MKSSRALLKRPMKSPAQWKRRRYTRYAMPAHESAQYSPNPTLEPGARVGYCQTTLNWARHDWAWHDWLGLDPFGFDCEMRVTMGQQLGRLNWHHMTVWSRHLSRQLLQLILNQKRNVHLPVAFSWLYRSKSEWPKTQFHLFFVINLSQ